MKELKGFIYEQDLPDDISAKDYSLWYRYSTLVNGVRQGPPLSTIHDFSRSAPITHNAISNALNMMIESKKSLDESLKLSLSNALRAMNNESAAQKVINDGLPLIIWVSSDLLEAGSKFLSAYAPVRLNPLLTGTKMVFSWVI